MSPVPSLPVNPFFAAPDQRAGLARQHFFEQGLRPSGMVSEAVIQSWARCLRSHPNPNHPVAFEPVTASRVHSALRSNRELLEAAGDELQRLRVTLAGTSGTAILTDAQGVIVGTSFTQARSHERLMPVSARIGVNLAEEAVGTTAPGITARTGQASVVQGSEHYFNNVLQMHCAAAPIRDVRGQLAGVLDLSSEGIPFGFDAATVVAHYAAEIENRLLCAQSRDHLVVRMQMSPALLDTPLVALLGVKGNGHMDWLNAAAARFLGLLAPQGQPQGASVEACLGLSAEQLFALATRADAQALHLPNGLTLWARFEWHTRDRPRGLQPPIAAQREAPAPQPQRPPQRPHPELHPEPHQEPHQEPLPTPATLRETEHQAVVRVLAECGGNISRAARALGVSRGLVYRHLQKARSSGP
jgi:transcriptional regulator of acetoin/glycerol metabolism